MNTIDLLWNLSRANQWQVARPICFGSQLRDAKTCRVQDSVIERWGLHSRAILRNDTKTGSLLSVCIRQYSIQYLSICFLFLFCLVVFVSFWLLVNPWCGQAFNLFMRMCRLWLPNKPEPFEQCVKVKRNANFLAWPCQDVELCLKTCRLFEGCARAC